MSLGISTWHKRAKSPEAADFQGGQGPPRMRSRTVFAIDVHRADRRQGPHGTLENIGRGPQRDS